MVKRLSIFFIIFIILITSTGCGSTSEGVVLNKDGSYQRSFACRGPDLESSTKAELVAFTARFNTALKRFGSGWAMFFEARRLPAHGYPIGRFADPASWLVDQERRAQFEEQGALFESRYVLTFVYMPPASDVSHRNASSSVGISGGRTTCCLVDIVPCR